MSKRLFVAFYFLGIGVLAHADFARADLIVYVETRENGQYVEPVDHQIHVRIRPIPFRIVLKNPSSSSEKVYTSTADGYSAISFELLGEGNKKKYIRRREQEETSSNFQQMQYLSPGQTLTFDMLLNARDWEGVVVPGQETASSLKVRAIYDNDNSKIYSDYYEVIFPDAQTGQTKEPVKSAGMLVG